MKGGNVDSSDESSSREEGERVSWWVGQNYYSVEWDDSDWGYDWSDSSDEDWEEWDGWSDDSSSSSSSGSKESKGHNHGSKGT